MTAQYIALGKKLLNEGQWVYNKRTNSRCLTLIDETLSFDVGKGEFPLVTTRKAYFRQAIGEMLGYIRGYTSTEQFHTLGVHTWDENAKNPVWTESPIGKEFIEEGHDLGLIYGGVDRLVETGWGIQFDQDGEIEGIRNKSALCYIYDSFTDFIVLHNKLREGIDDRGLIWSFWRPEFFKFGCLRPCVYEHQFSLVNDTLHLSSTARSQDYPLGTVFNLVQVYFLLWLMAELTGHKPGIAKLRLVNIHLYENQLEQFKAQMERDPFPHPKLVCNKPLTLRNVLGTHDEIEDNLHPNDFDVEGYQYHPAIKYPFTV